MAISYATLAQLKARHDIPDTLDDGMLGEILQGISRAIDEVCRRVFYVPTSDATLYFTATSPRVLWPGDLVSVTTLKTDDDGDRTYETTWASTDYDLEPFNAARVGRPYTCIRVAPLGTKLFPTIGKGVQIVGKPGWPEVPDQVREATLLSAQRLFMRKDAPLGVMGSPEMGELKQIVKDDPEIMMLLRSMENKGSLV